MLLKRGHRGPAVELLKDRLRELGYLAEAGSCYGEATDGAVRAFQQAQGLKVDGVVGPVTWARLFPPVKPTREYLDRVLYGGRQVYDHLDDIVAAVAAGEGGAFDALQLNRDGAGLSFGLLQWAQAPGRLHLLLQSLRDANPAKFVEIFGEGDTQTARKLLAQTRGRGLKIPLWRGEWPLRFWLAGRDLEFQRVQRDLAPGTWRPSWTRVTGAIP